LQYPKEVDGKKHHEDHDDGRKHKCVEWYYKHFDEYKDKFEHKRHDKDVKDWRNKFDHDDDWKNKKQHHDRDDNKKDKKERDECERYFDEHKDEYERKDGEKVSCQSRAGVLSFELNGS
jgi:hypothetical protein